MLYYIIKIIFYFLLIYNCFLSVLFIKRNVKKEKGLFIAQYIFYFGAFMFTIASLIMLFSFNKNKVINYKFVHLISGYSFCFLFGIVGTLLIMLSTNWYLKLYEDKFLYSNFMGLKKEVSYKKISFIEAYNNKNKSNIDIYIGKNKIKVQNDFSYGDRTQISNLIYNYRKRNYS